MDTEENQTPESSEQGSSEENSTQTFEDFKAEILEDGVIDDDEVQRIEARVYEDGKVDKEEADFLFELNDAVSGKENSPAWGKLFARAISDFVLADDDTPNVVDETEAQYIIDKIQGDGQVDDAERELLTTIKERAMGMDATLETFISENT